MPLVQSPILVLFSKKKYMFNSHHTRLRWPGRAPARRFITLSLVGWGWNKDILFDTFLKLLFKKNANAIIVCEVYEIMFKNSVHLKILIQ